MPGRGVAGACEPRRAGALRCRAARAVSVRGDPGQPTARAWATQSPMPVEGALSGRILGTKFAICISSGVGCSRVSPCNFAH